MWDVFVTADNGREWQLTGARRPRVWIPMGGMSGMVATSAETRSTVVGRPGSRQVATRVDTLAPSWELMFKDRDGTGLGKDVRDWLAAWRQGVTVSVSSPTGRLSTRGRVPPDAAPDLEFSPFSHFAKNNTLILPWSWEAERAVWEQSHSDTGEVTIVNTGDVVTTPTIMWAGAGHSVTVRGVTTQLPTVSSHALMVLDHARNCMVTDTAGRRLDGPSEWSRKQALNLSVVIPPKETETITVTEGVKVSWSVGVKSPWR